MRKKHSRYVRYNSENDSMKNISMFTLMLIILVSTSGIHSEVLAEANPTVSLDWGETLKIVGLSGIVSGILSAVFTHYFSIKKLEKEIELKKREEGKRCTSELKAHLDKMIANPEFQDGSEPSMKVRETIDDIDKIVIPNSHLLDVKITTKWWDVRYSLKSGLMPEVRKVVGEFSAEVDRVLNAL